MGVLGLRVAGLGHLSTGAPGGSLSVVLGVAALLLPLGLRGGQAPAQPMLHGWLLLVVGGAQASGPLVLGLLGAGARPVRAEVVLDEALHLPRPLGATLCPEDLEGSLEFVLSLRWALGGPLAGAGP